MITAVFTWCCSNEANIKTRAAMKRSTPKRRPLSASPRDAHWLLIGDEPRTKWRLQTAHQRWLNQNERNNPEANQRRRLSFVISSGRWSRRKRAWDDGIDSIIYSAFSTRYDYDRYWVSGRFNQDSIGHLMSVGHLWSEVLTGEQVVEVTLNRLDLNKDLRLLNRVGSHVDGWYRQEGGAG